MQLLRGSCLCANAWSSDGPEQPIHGARPCARNTHALFTSSPLLLCIVSGLHARLPLSSITFHPGNLATVGTCIVWASPSTGGGGKRSQRPCPATRIHNHHTHSLARTRTDALQPRTSLVSLSTFVFPVSIFPFATILNPAHLHLSHRSHRRYDFLRRRRLSPLSLVCSSLARSTMTLSFLYH
jgi:hypothetical protein